MAGPRLAPNSLPFEVVLRTLRQPPDRMPTYAARVLTDQQAADIYAYFKSLPP